MVPEGEQALFCRAGAVWIGYVSMGPQLLDMQPLNHEEAMYPSLPGVEGAPALAREARRADSRHPGRMW